MKYFMKEVTLQEQIDEILDWFDFCNIAERFYSEDENEISFVTKESPDGPVYSKKEFEAALRARARKALKKGWECWKGLKEYSPYSVCVYDCGGFRVFADKDGCLELVFYVESFDCSNDQKELKYVD